MENLYSLESIKRLIRNRPSLSTVWSVLYKDWYNRSLEVNRKWYNWKYGQKSGEFITPGWDNLLILDATRFDMISDLEQFDSHNIEYKYTPGSCSDEFIQEEFIGKNLHDTIYITANPHVKDIPRDVFYKVANLLDTDWDDEEKTVMPEKVVKRSLEIAEEYPDKRLIIHFMQPHFPFIGPSGDLVDAAIENRDTKVRHPWHEQMWGGKC